MQFISKEKDCKSRWHCVNGRAWTIRPARNEKSFHGPIPAGTATQLPTCDSDSESLWPSTRVFLSSGTNAIAVSWVSPGLLISTIPQSFPNVDTPISMSQWSYIPTAFQLGIACISRISMDLPLWRFQTCLFCCHELWGWLAVKGLVASNNSASWQSQPHATALQQVKVG